MIWLIFTEHFVSGKEAINIGQPFVMVLVFFMYFCESYIDI